MATLQFPLNPTVNQQYSFGGKTWYWTGQAWRLTTQGAINGIPIGNITPASGNFTTLTANTFSTTNLDLPGNLTVDGTATLNNISVTGGIVTGNVDVHGNLRTDSLFVDNDSYFSGNVTTAQYFYGNGRNITGIVASSGTYIENGNTIVDIPIENGNVEITVSGTPNIALFSNTQITVGVDIIPSNANASIGSLAEPFKDGYFSGNSVYVGGAKLSANSSSFVITNPSGGDFIFNEAGDYTPYANANATSLLANFGSNTISTTGNITAANFIGNVRGNLTVNAGNTEVIFSDQGVALGNANFTFNKATNVVGITGNLTATGNVQANYLLGNATALTGAMVDRGPDTNNWNTMTQMGVYTVNRTSWAGTTGTPLDSQIFVGLLEVKNSTNTAIEQVFYPGTVDLGNVKIQWNRANWDGSWTTWIKIVNDDQVFTGGTF